MSKPVSYLIIGNGIVGVTAAEILRAEQPTSLITVIADDPFPVYYRPALKDYLAGKMPEEKLWARPTTFYQEKRIRFMLGRVTGIDTAHHIVYLHDGQHIAYHRLLLANGARARQLTCPGLNLAGVSTLRTVADYQEILRRLPTTSHIAICGSGTLALESAETLRHAGFQVTHLLRNRTLWSEVIDSTASDLVLHEERRAGIDVRTDETIAQIVGQNGQVSEVITTQGNRISCQIVLIAIGIDPIIDFISRSGIACGRGVQVNESMQTSAADVYAAGDVIEIVDAVSGRTRVLGQWYPAIQQARIAAYSMLDMTDVATGGPFYNATFLYGLDFVSVGLTTQPPDHQSYQEIVAPPKPRSYRKVLLKHGMIIGALFLGERQQAMACKRAIDQHVNLTPVADRLFDESFALDAWLDELQIAEATFTIRKPDTFNHVAYKAFLIPIPHPQIPLTIPEIQLNQQGHPDLIGRHPGATLYLDHSSVSRRHAEISYGNGQYFLRDLGSKNSVFVNGKALAPHDTHALQQNDRIRFGDVRFSFQLRRTTAHTDDHPTISMAQTNNTTFLHLQGTQLHNNTTRMIPDTMLDTLQGAPSLALITQNASPVIIPLTATPNQHWCMTIGRDKENTIALQDAAASRKHAEIFATPNGFYIRDLQSSNGVFINKIKINNPYQLSDKDRIVIGNTLLYCSLPQTRAQSATTGTLQLATTKHTAPLPENGTKKELQVAGLSHRMHITSLSEQRVQFEIDMCIGCDRCMVACPLPLSTKVTIADLNHATISDAIAPHVAGFTHACIMCGSCVPVCPVDNHRDLLMLSLKQRVGELWDAKPDMDRVASQLPSGWTLADLINHLRRQAIFNDPQRIPENYLLHLVASSSLLSLPANADVFREGEYGRDLYIILHGRLAALSATISGQELPVTILNAGELAGEYGMLTGQPYTTTIITQTPAQILRIPEQVMQHFLELIPSAKHFFAQLNNARSIEGILQRMALFQGVADDDIHALTRLTQVKYYDREERLFVESSVGQRPARETLHVILEGFVKVARHTLTDGEDAHLVERIIAYRQGGDYFAGGLDLLGDGKAVTVTAITRTRVAEVPRQALLDLFQRYPEVNQRFAVRLRDYLESTVSAHSAIFKPGALTTYLSEIAPSDPAARKGLHALVSDGVVEGTEVLVIDLDKCIHCNECEEACARRHGHSRMNRTGMVVGNISIATACRQCQDPVCLLCSRAGIARLPNGEVYITESCIGCGICAERCPYGAISIVNVDEPKATPTSWQRFSTFFSKGAGKERTRQYLPVTNVATLDNHRVAAGPLEQPSDAYEELRKKVAIKCDLCAGYSDQACVQACPVGAAIRVQPTKFFGSTEDILRR